MTPELEAKFRAIHYPWDEHPEDDRVQHVARARARIDEQIADHGQPMDHEMAAVLETLDEANRYASTGDCVCYDPARRSGLPTLGHTRVPAEDIVWAVWGGYSHEYEDPADWGYSRRQILIACWWFVDTNRTSRRKKVREVVDAWRDWELMASRLLRWSDELPPLPPSAAEMRP